MRQVPSYEHLAGVPQAMEASRAAGSACDDTAAASAAALDETQLYAAMRGTGLLARRAVICERPYPGCAACARGVMNAAGDVACSGCGQTLPPGAFVRHCSNGSRQTPWRCIW